MCFRFAILASALLFCATTASGQSADNLSADNIVPNIGTDEVDTLVPDGESIAELDGSDPVENAGETETSEEVTSGDLAEDLVSPELSLSSNLGLEVSATATAPSTGEVLSTLYSDLESPHGIQSDGVFRPGCSALQSKNTAILRNHALPRTDLLSTITKSVWG